MQKLLDDLVADGAAGVLLHYRDGQGEWRGSSGVAELGTDRPIDPDGWFRVGSITKTFTAAVALTLVADGLLELDATYDEWGPTVTLRQLLNHTTGIYNYTDDLGDEAAIVRERYDHWDPERALRMAVPNGEGGRGYGLGIGRRQLADGTIVWGHNGGIFGYLTSSFHAADGSRQFTASYTVAGTESFSPDDLIPAVFESVLN